MCSYAQKLHILEEVFLVEGIREPTTALSGGSIATMVKSCAQRFARIPPRGLVETAPGLPVTLTGTLA